MVANPSAIADQCLTATKTYIIKPNQRQILEAEQEFVQTEYRTH